MVAGTAFGEQSSLGRFPNLFAVRARAGHSSGQIYVEPSFDAAFFPRFRGGITFHACIVEMYCERSGLNIGF